MSVSFDATKLTENCVVITGASGQDGLLATELLSRRGYSVFAIVKDAAPIYIYQRLVPKAFWMPYSSLLLLAEALRSGSRIRAIIHLASNSSVGQSWLDPVKTLLDSSHSLRPLVELAETCDAPLVIAGSSQIYSPSEKPVSNRSELSPQSPYGVAKLAEYHLLRMLREEGRVRGSSVTLFNHDSPLRAPSALMSRLSREFVGVIRGDMSRVVVPNPHVSRDFSWAPDFVKVLCNPDLWDSGKDIMLGSGVATTIHSLVQTAAGSFAIEDENFEYLTTKVDHRPTVSGDGATAKAFGLRQTVESKFLLAKIVELLLEESNEARSPGETKRAILLRLVDAM